MSLVSATLASLTRWLGANPATQQDVVYSEASAKRALSRRAFLRTAGAVAAGVVLADRLAEPAGWTLENGDVTGYDEDEYIAALVDELNEGYAASTEGRLRELSERIKEYRPRGPVYMHPDDHAKLVELGYAPPLEVYRTQPGESEYQFSRRIPEGEPPTLSPFDAHLKKLYTQSGAFGKLKCPNLPIVGVRRRPSPEWAKVIGVDLGDIPSRSS